VTHAAQFIANHLVGGGMQPRVQFFGDAAKDYFGASVNGKIKLQKDTGKVTVVNGAEF
jgi:hypothetical protein